MKVNLQQARAPPLTSELDLLDLRYTGSASTPTLIRVATTYKDPQSYTGTSWLCCRLYCYECAAQVTMLTATNKQYFGVVTVISSYHLGQPGFLGESAWWRSQSLFPNLKRHFFLPRHGCPVPSDSRWWQSAEHASSFSLLWVSLYHKTTFQKQHCWPNLIRTICSPLCTPFLLS